MANECEIPLRINLTGTLGDDVYWVFNDFTLDGSPYPDSSTVALYLELASDPVGTNFNLVGTFDPDLTGNRSKVSFKFPAADNTIIGKFNYDVKVTYPNSDVFTHIIGDIDITADVKNAS